MPTDIKESPCIALFLAAQGGQSDRNPITGLPRIPHTDADDITKADCNMSCPTQWLMMGGMQMLSGIRKI